MDPGSFHRDHPTEKNETAYKYEILNQTSIKYILIKRGT